MVKATLAKDGAVEMVLDGDVFTLAVDVLVIANAVYNAMLENAPDDAEKFRLIFLAKAMDRKFWELRPDGTAVHLKVPKKAEQDNLSEEELT